MKIRIAQLIVSKDLQHNLEKITSVLESSIPNEWVLFPEGMISGYYPEEENFLEQLDINTIQKHITQIEKKVKEKNLHCLIGSALKDNNDWYNAVLFITSEKTIIYKKNNLSTLDRKHFKEGNEINNYIIDEFNIGIQMCRELAFPEPWKLLKKKGAQVIFHINNAIKESDKMREHVLITRAFENQVWLCSVNNASPPQTMSSMIIDPFGKVIWQSAPQKEEIYTMDLDLFLVSTQYLQQERSDLVEVVEK